MVETFRHEAAKPRRTLLSDFTGWLAIVCSEQMLPLDRLLHRIKWDREFGAGEFALGYDDRVLGDEAVVALSSITFDAQQHDAFTVTDGDGIAHNIPLHRVRRVYKNGVIIWSRTPLPKPAD